MPSLAHSVPMPLKWGRRGKAPSSTILCATSLFQYMWKVSEVKWREVITFLVLYFFGTFICNRKCIYINFHISKKVQKHFLIALKFWWSWDRDRHISKLPILGGFFIFRPKLQFFGGLGALLRNLFVIFSCKISVFARLGGLFE